MAAVGGCGCAGMVGGPRVPPPGANPPDGPGAPDPTQNPFQVGQHPGVPGLPGASRGIAEAFTREYNIKVDTSTNEAAFRTADQILAARSTRIADIEAAIKADTAAQGQENPLAARRLLIEKTTNEQLSAVKAKFEPLAQHMTQLDRDAYIGIFADATRSGSLDAVRMMGAYLPLAQRAGLLNQPAVDAIKGVLQVVGAQNSRLAEIAVAIAADASRSGSFNTEASARLDAEMLSVRKLNEAGASLQSIGKVMTAEQSQQVLAAVQAYSQSGNVDAAVATIGQVVTAAGGTP